MNILLTGGNGFLGSYIKKSLFDHHIKILGRSNADFEIDLENAIPKFNSPFDIVIHSAGMAHVSSKNELINEKIYKVNVQGTKNLLEGLYNSSIPRKLVYISSVSVYGLLNGTHIDESQVLNAKDAYGLSKIKSEQIILEWCGENNVLCTILRLPLVIGKNPPGNLKNMIKAIKSGYYFNVGGGVYKKSMVLAEDVASYILAASEIGGIYNLTDGHHPSFKELSNQILFKLGGSRTIISLPSFVAKFCAQIGDIFGSKSPFNTNKYNKMINTLTFCDKKARSQFGWNPKSVLDEINLY